MPLLGIHCVTAAARGLADAIVLCMTAKGETSGLVKGPTSNLASAFGGSLAPFDTPEAGSV